MQEVLSSKLDPMPRVSVMQEVLSSGARGSVSNLLQEYLSCNKECFMQGVLSHARGSVYARGSVICCKVPTHLMQEVLSISCKVIGIK